MARHRPADHSGTTAHEPPPQITATLSAAEPHKDRPDGLRAGDPVAPAPADASDDQPPDRPAATDIAGRCQPCRHPNTRHSPPHPPSRPPPEARAEATIPIVPKHPAASFNPASMRSAIPLGVDLTHADLTEPSRFQGVDSSQTGLNEAAAAAFVAGLFGDWCPVCKDCGS